MDAPLVTEMRFVMAAQRIDDVDTNIHLHAVVQTHEGHTVINHIAAFFQFTGCLRLQHHRHRVTSYV